MNSSLKRIDVAVDGALRTRCPRTALGCVTAQVEAPTSQEALIAELINCESGNSKID
jgi:hypothetical protein